MTAGCRDRPVSPRSLPDCSSRRAPWRCPTVPSSSPRSSASASCASAPTVPSTSSPTCRAAPTVSPSGPKAPCTCATTAGRSRPIERGGLLVPGPVRPRPLQRRKDPAPRTRRDVGRSLLGVLRPAVAVAERPRDGRPRRLLLQRLRRPRRARRTDGRSRRRLLRPLRRLPHRRGGVSRAGAERRRAQPRRLDAVLRRDVHRPCVPPAGRRARRARGRRASPTRRTRGRCCAAYPVCRCSTPSPSTRRDGCASERC